MKQRVLVFPLEPLSAMAGAVECQKPWRQAAERLGHFARQNRQEIPPGPGQRLCLRVDAAPELSLDTGFQTGLATRLTLTSAYLSLFS
jgi:hypothetical protein